MDCEYSDNDVEGDLEELVTEGDFNSYLSESSLRNVGWLANIWTRWARTRDAKEAAEASDLRVLLTNNKQLFVQLLPQFFLDVRKLETGAEYPVKTLNFMLHLIQMIIKDLRLEFSVLEDDEFSSTRRYLNKKIDEMMERGEQLIARKAEVISEEMEAYLYRTGVLGDKDSRTLLHTVYFINTKYFGLRSRQQHRELRLGPSAQIKVTGKPPLEKIVFQDTAKFGTVSSEIYPQGGRNCPVRLIKMYLSKIPSKATSFYCRPIERMVDGKWYANQPVGKNSLHGLMRDVAYEAGWDSTKLWSAISLRYISRPVNCIKSYQKPQSPKSLFPYRAKRPHSAIMQKAKPKEEGNRNIDGVRDKIYNMKTLAAQQMQPGQLDYKESLSMSPCKQPCSRSEMEFNCYDMPNIELNYMNSLKMVSRSNYQSRISRILLRQVVRL